MVAPSQSKPAKEIGAKMRAINAALISGGCALSMISDVHAFSSEYAAAYLPQRTSTMSVSTAMNLSKNENDGEDSDILSEADPRDELAPPLFSLTRKSILFDESSSSSSSGDDFATDSAIPSGNGMGSTTLAVWSGAKQVLPPLLTGASKPDWGDKDALGSLYNLLFVRLPTVCVGIGYLVNLLNGHPLMVDPLGTGAFEVPPPAVIFALWCILRY